MDVKKILDYWSLLEYVEQFVNVAAAGRWGKEIEADILPEGLKELQKLILIKGIPQWCVPNIFDHTEACTQCLV